MMKPIKIDHKDIKDSVRTESNYIQVDDQKYLLMEVEEVNGDVDYIVTDSEEEKQLLHALEGDNPILSEEDINNMPMR